MRNDIKPYHDNNGFYIVGLMDFLLSRIWWNHYRNRRSKISMTQYRTHIADGILRFLKQKQIYITEVFYMHILRVLLQKQSQLRQKLQ